MCKIKSKSSPLLSLSALAISLASSLTLSLPEDRYQPINVQANKAVQNNSPEQMTTVYTGDVVITQGSMKINGDEVTIVSQNGEIQHLVAVGQPARFEQQSSADKAPVIAHGNTIDYRLAKDLVVLKEQASIEQEGSLVTGAQIDYNISEERVVANGGKDRVNITLPPSKPTPTPEAANGDS